MRFAEILLRIGTALVAWMVLSGYFLWLAAFKPDCSNGGGDMLRLLTFLSPFALGSAISLRVTVSMPEVHRILRWLGLPIFLLALVAFPRLLAISQQKFLATNVINIDIGCIPNYWSPVQMTTVIICIWLIFTVCRTNDRPEK